MNLLYDAWIPVEDINGLISKVAPIDLPGSTFVRIAHNRADFSAMTLELLCCIFQTALAPINSLERMDYIKGKKLPMSDQFKILCPAFELDGPGPRFMQVPRSSDVSESPVNTLLFEAPGESTLKLNKDFFFARNDDATMCSHCAPIALFLNQSHARPGGNGYKTGPRESSVLAVLVTGATVWESILLNLLTIKWFDDLTGNPDGDVLHSFPWLYNQSALKQNQTLPLSTFGRFGVLFWTPVALHLVFTPNADSAPCLTCNSDTERHVSGVVRNSTVARLSASARHPHAGWNPLGNKSAGRAIETPSDRFTAEQWQALTVGASVNDSLPAWSALMPRSVINPRLHAFGFALNNMSAQFWMDESTPTFAPETPEYRENLKSAAEKLVDVSKKAVAALKSSLFRNSKKAIENPSFTLTMSPSEAGQMLWAALSPKIQFALANMPAGEPLSTATLSSFTTFARNRAVSIFDTATQDDGSNYEVSFSLMKRRSNLFKKLHPKK